MNRKIRVYVDASAVGGKFNKRLAEQTKPFWNAFDRGEITIIVSDVLVREVENAATCPQILRFDAGILD